MAKLTSALQRLVAQAAIDERYFARVTGGIEREVLSHYRAAYKDVRSELAGIFEKYAVDGKLTLGEMNKFNRLESLEKELNRITGLSSQRARATTEAGIRTTFNEAVIRNQLRLQGQVARELNFGSIPKKAVQQAIESPLEKIAFERLRNNGRARIRSALAQNLIRGEGFQSFARDIRKAINGTASDALRIARTETARVRSEAHLKVTEQGEQLGLEIRKVWIANSDDRVRSTHKSMNLQVADKDGFFTLPGGEKTRGPTLSGIAEEDINCRCVWVDEVVNI